MARVTEAEVKEIIEIADDFVTLDPFILIANEIVNIIAVNDTTITDTILKEIERWLSAHFTAIRDPRVDSEKAGSVGAKYQYKVDIGFEVTTYGQMAKRIDSSGTLAKMDADAKSGGPVTIEVESW